MRGLRGQGGWNGNAWWRRANECKVYEERRCDWGKEVEMWGRKRVDVKEEGKDGVKKENGKLTLMTFKCQYVC